MDERWIWLLAVLGALALAIALAGWWLASAQDEAARALIGRVGRLPWRQKARLAWELLRDDRVPLWVRAIIPALVLYLLLPLDIIPDFIPLLGHLDDALVLLLAVGLLLRFTPPEVIEDHLGALEQAAADEDGLGG
jgi:uncharacterized membrane protein YkvA (DUF1232 family)